MKNLFIVGSTAILASLLAVACEERIVQPMIVALKQPGTGSDCGTGAPPAAATLPPSECKGRCCPKNPVCYPSGNPSLYSGAECLAQRDNTTATRWQLRQTLSISVKPAGLHAPGVPGLLARRSELKSDQCGAPMGSGGFIQLTDFDTMAGVSRTGFAKFEPDLTSALANSLCFVEQDIYQTDYALPRLYDPPPGWPKGLPAPMPMPWKVTPVSAVKLDQDFTLPADRTTLLARFAEGGDLFGKASGVFYFDKEKGTMHGYSPVTYIVNYDSSSQYVVVPIREAELTQRFNDPDHPNCAGLLLGDNPELADDCIGAGEGAKRAWGCPKGYCSATDLAPTKIHGYFLLAEIEQVASLMQTLCSLFANHMYPNWTIPDSDLRCRSDSHWNPTDPVHGIPTGDWCATTNEAAQGDCHDALESVSYAAFQAFPIRDGTCPPI